MEQLLELPPRPLLPGHRVAELVPQERQRELAADSLAADERVQRADVRAGRFRRRPASSGDSRLVCEGRAGPGCAGRCGHPAEGQGQALHEIATCGHGEALTRSSPMPELRSENEIPRSFTLGLFDEVLLDSPRVAVQV